MAAELASQQRSSISSTASQLIPTDPSAAAAPTNTAASALSHAGAWLLKMASFGGGGDVPAADAASPAAASASLTAMKLLDTVHGGGTMPSAGEPTAAASFGFHLDGSTFKGFGYVSAYMTSSWAFLCIFMAIVLNRTLVYASLRRPARLSRRIRFMIRVAPILLFLYHIHSILLALRCQTSPHLPLDVFPQAANIPYSSSDTGGFFYNLSRLLTPWLPSSSHDVGVCQDAGMLPRIAFDNNDAKLRGSLQLLWPIYKTIAFSLFLSTFSHALSGPALAVGNALGPSTSSDTGLTLFEDSLAFAEAEALVDPTTGNVAPEVLYIALISCFAHLTANLIGVFASQPVRPRGTGAGGGVRYRLITTGIWGIAFLGGFAWSLWRAIRGDVRESGRPGLYGFPKVCIVGFLPHLVIVVGIAACGAIYLLAAIVSSLASSSSSSTSPARPSRNRPLVSFGGDADADFTGIEGDAAADGTGTGTGPASANGLLDFGNLQATITLSTLSLSLHEDFYTTLLKTGFLVLTAVSDLTFLQEGETINTPALTWLEKERARMLARQREWERRMKGRQAWIMQELRSGAPGGVGGYANERKSVAGWMVGLPETQGRRGVGDKQDHRRGVRGSGKWVAAIELLKGIIAVVGSWGVEGLRKVGVLSPRPGGGARNTGTSTTNNKKGSVSNNVVARRTQTRGAAGVGGNGGASVEDRNASPWMTDDEKLYAAFLRGEFYQENGNNNNDDDDDDEAEEEEYNPNNTYDDDDDDTTSVVSYTSQSSDGDSSDDDDDDDGSHTPTRTRSVRTLSRSPTPEPNPLHVFARLLDPQTPEQKHMAQIMSRHLFAERDQHVTRTSAGVKRLGGSSSATSFPSSSSSSALNTRFEEDEEDLLELLNVARGGGRDGRDGRATHPGVGECVVCQSSPRTVIIWPCRCLSLCEECRVALAARGFARCVCCRGEVGGFSRLYVP